MRPYERRRGNLFVAGRSNFCGPQGARFADKTRQAVAFEQLRTQRTHIIVYAGGYFDIFETLSFVQMVLHLAPSIQEKLSVWLEEHLNQIQKRE